jgi:hypothetical protein
MQSAAENDEKMEFVFMSVSAFIVCNASTLFMMLLPCCVVPVGISGKWSWSVCGFGFLNGTTIDAIGRMV